MSDLMHVKQAYCCQFNVQPVLKSLAKMRPKHLCGPEPVRTARSVLSPCVGGWRHLQISTYRQSSPERETQQRGQTLFMCPIYRVEGSEGGLWSCL